MDLSPKGPEPEHLEFGASMLLIPCSSGSSKRRRLAPHGWENLPQDLLQLIAWRVLAGDLLDYVRFGAVCSTWKSSTVRLRGRGLLDPRFYPRRWMLLPEGNGLYPGHPNLRGYVRFFNLSTGAFVRVYLPLFDEHIVLESTEGLLLLFRHRDRDTAMRLLHPFTGDMAELPPLLSLLPQLEPQPRFRYMTEDNKLRELRIFLSGICAVITTSATGAITVMLGLDMILRVAHATIGEQRWTLSSWKLPRLQTQTVSFQGKLFATSIMCDLYQNKNKVAIYQINPPQQGSELPPPEMIAECPLDGTTVTVYPVECGSELMLVCYNDLSHSHLLVYRFADLISRKIVPVTSIGGYALFLLKRGVCVSPNKGFPSVLGNSITCMRISRVEQYHLDSGTWSPAIDEDILHKDKLPARPYTLIHHIFTCCHRCYWNKGIMVCAAIRPDWSVKPSMLHIGV